MELLLDPGRIETAVAAEMKLSADQQIEQPAQLAKAILREDVHAFALVKPHHMPRPIIAPMRMVRMRQRQRGIQDRAR